MLVWPGSTDPGATVRPPGLAPDGSGRATFWTRAPWGVTSSRSCELLLTMKSGPLAVLYSQPSGSAWPGLGGAGVRQRSAREREGDRSLEIRSIDLGRIAAPRRIQDIDLAVVVGVDVQAVAALVPGGARGLVGDLGPAPAARAGGPPAGQVAAPGRLEDVGAGPVVGHLLDLAVDVDDAALGLAVVRWSVGQAGWVGAGRGPPPDPVPPA